MSTYHNNMAQDQVEQQLAKNQQQLDKLYEKVTRLQGLLSLEEDKILEFISERKQLQNFLQSPA